MATWAPVLDIFKTFEKILGWVFGLIFSIHGNGQVHVVLDEMCCKTVMSPILSISRFLTRFGLTLFLLYINDLPGNVTCCIAIYADDTTLHSKFNWAFDMWQQLELASKSDSDLQKILDQGRKWLKMIMLEKRIFFIWPLE